MNIKSDGLQEDADGTRALLESSVDKGNTTEPLVLLLTQSHQLPLKRTVNHKS